MTKGNEQKKDSRVSEKKKNLVEMIATFCNFHYCILFDYSFFVSNV